MEELLKSVQAAYAEDSSGAGLSIAWLADTEEYYASVVRYAERFGRGKQVICSARSADLESCLRGLREQWEALHASA